MLALSISTWLLGPPVQRPNEAALIWAAPAECPSAEAMVERIDAFAPGVLAGARVRATVELIESELIESGYRVDLVLGDGDGDVHRVLVGVDCEEVSNAVALLVAVFLDPLRSAREVNTRRSAEAPMPEQPALAEEPARALEPEPVEPEPTSINFVEPASVFVEPASARTPARTPARVALRAFGGGGYGPINAGMGELGASVAVFKGRWRVELGGAWTPARELRTSAGLGGRFESWRVAARGCFVAKLGARDRLELPLCPGFELGRVHGRGLDDLPVVLSATIPWIAFALGQGLWFAPLERLAFGVDLQLAVPLFAGRFLVETVAVQRIAPVSVRGLVGIELRLP